MNGESVTDLILRAVAALRERQEIPDVESPQIVVSRIPGDGVVTFHSNVGQALTATRSDDNGPALSPHVVASLVASYLAEVVDAVPAYHDIASVTATEDGSLTITLRTPEKP